MTSYYNKDLGIMCWRLKKDRRLYYIGGAILAALTLFVLFAL